jgi:hypothetical protein
MDREVNPTRDLLQRVASGELTAAEAEKQLAAQHLALLEHAAVDLHRASRRGRPEVIYGEGKTTEQIVSIAARMVEAGQNCLATRLSDEKRAALRTTFANHTLLESVPGRLMGITVAPTRPKKGLVAILAAGTSDLAVAEEAALTAQFLGSPVERAYDVGVAGIHRLFRRADLLLNARVLIVVAGMEGALPGVVSGLAQQPVIAVPTSVGYGANFSGLSALLTMINTCSPGCSVVNIDNGFGAGYLADLMNGLGEGNGAHES